jgi:hypothetical protein
VVHTTTFLFLDLFTLLSRSASYSWTAMEVKEKREDVESQFSSSANLLVGSLQSFSLSNLSHTFDLQLTSIPSQSSSSNVVTEESSSSGLLSSMMYTFCSVAMVLSNKAISTTLNDVSREKMPQLSVILFQCLVAVVFVEGAKFFKIVDYPAFSMKTAKAWLPLNLLFIGMLVTGFLSLVYVSVPIVTVFKNLSNLVTVTGDCYIFGER